ncbi:YbaK/EbsC family protein [Alkalithermobacter paradoxus]|uniref:Proline--tRNA ligase n=1 Tax=Alkalithermobacter paradoxus TaxID=29349 RepID=A0A1V4I4N4_9FIRM|nr:proline--tRNA ligase [[Clostridium] thermoalcaliphilum]
MKLSDIYLKTYKECPLSTDFDSLKLLYRSGILKYLEDGGYLYTIIGNLFFDKLKEFIKGEFKEFSNISISGNYEKAQNSLNNEIKSYKELPLNIGYRYTQENEYYKFKDGLLNPKIDNIIKFIKISSSEDVYKEKQNIDHRIESILNSLNINYLNNKEDNGNKYFYQTNYPLKDILLCENCGYNNYKHEAKTQSEKDLSTDEIKDIEYIYTPNVSSIEDLESFLEISPKKLIKTLIFKCEDKIVAVLLRGDRTININSLSKFLKVPKEKISMASEEDVKAATNAEVGFAGPIGIKVDNVLADEEVLYIKNGVVGANKTDYHIKNVNYNKDFKVDNVDNFKLSCENDKCIKCEGKLKTVNGTNFIDVQITPTDYTYLNSQGKEEKIYNLEIKFYIDRLISIIVEENKDEKGIKWPKTVSPFDYEIIIGNIKSENEYKWGMNIYEILKNKGYNVLIDDRKERIGFKFKDCELIGIPDVIVVGKDIENEMVEIRSRIDDSNIKENIRALTSVE